jgi:hypothetical protein
MNNQLSNISTQYSKFSKGQYVEHTQFNEFLDFFEDQDRLSRVMLQGVGVVCGFQPKLTYTNNKVSGILLSQGIAITTDGDLLTLNSKSRAKSISDDIYMSELKTIDFDGKQYTHFRVYDNNKIMYPAFHDNSENQVELWELATSAEAKDGFEPISGLDSLENKYLLLYLEEYEKEVKPCRGVDCDNHGIQQIRNLKVLVTTAAGIAQILEKDEVSPHPLSLDLVDEEKLKRVILQPVSISGTALRQKFSDAVTQSGYNFLFQNIDLICSIMGFPIINRATFGDKLIGLASQNENFQYAYGVLKDIIDTYSEIVKLFSKTFTKHLPNLKSFPKHIMLGKTVQDTGFDSSRHQFYNSQVLDNEKNNYSRLKLLIERINELAIRFIDPSEVAAENGIRITPSQNLSPLSSKAIPFYYEITESLLDVWNFDKTVNRVSNTNLSFATAMLSDNVHIQQPLGYNIDRNTFYRIEGHQGMDYSLALSQIRRLKDTQQLGFDVIALSLAQLTNNKDISKAYFPDYVEKHPGLEYLGGVKRGGTFVVVYESETNRTVIADFAVPYICCTPKPNVALSLPVNTVCESASRLIFKVTPANGIVRADVAAGLTGGVQLVNGQYMFNPQLVENSLVDTEIAFTVNGKQTNCIVKVIPVPEVVVSVANFVYPEGNASKTTVVFNVSGENSTDYNYKWDFLGNGNYIPLQPNSYGNVKYDYFKIDATKPVNILITSNGCTQVKTLTEWYVPPTSALALSITASSTRPSTSDVVLLRAIVSGATGNLMYEWQSSTPKAIVNPINSAQPSATFSGPGTYTFTLTVKDMTTGQVVTGSIEIVVT